MVLELLESAAHVATDPIGSITSTQGATLPCSREFRFF